jgi:hypothetical protein
MEYFKPGISVRRFWSVRICDFWVVVALDDFEGKGLEGLSRH